MSRKEADNGEENMKNITLEEKLKLLVLKNAFDMQDLDGKCTKIATSDGTRRSGSLSVIRG